ncbi:MAG: TMEM175 family protein [Candidatus Aquilonibacter sp.]
MKSPLRRERYTDRQESPARVEALTDGIFSVAMTLLVLGLAIDAHEASAASANADPWKALVDGGIGWKLLFFLASFVVAAWFWTGHVLIFWGIERMNRVLVWWNVAFYIPIVLVPFTTALLGAFPHSNLAGVFYLLDILGASLTTDAIWFYSVRAGLIAERTPPELVRAIGRRLVYVTVIMAVASAVAAFFPYVAIGAVLLAMLYVAVTTGSRLLVEDPGLTR